MNKKRVLVCGGRNFGEPSEAFSLADSIRAAAEKKFLFEFLDQRKDMFDLLIHGSAKGADLAAEEWAKSREIPYLGHPARWKEHGRSAGPRRNDAMLARWHPQIVIAFPGGKGTAHMIQAAKGFANIEVIEVRP